MQFDYSYLRQYSENNLLLDLDPYLGNIIETEPLPQNILDIGVVNDTTYGIPTSTNAWGLFTNPVLLEQAGVEEFEGGSWEDYTEWMGEVTDGIRRRVLGRHRLHRPHPELRAAAALRGLVPLQRRRRARLRRGAPHRVLGVRARTSATASASRSSASRRSLPRAPSTRRSPRASSRWDNFGAGYLAGLGAGYTELGLIAPPVTEEGAKDLYLKPSMLHTISAKTEHPEAAATLVELPHQQPAVG